MKVQIRVADTGLSKTYVVPPNEKFQYIQEHIKKQVLVEPEHQVLISKTGSVLLPQQRFELLHHQLQKTYVQDGQTTEQLKHISCIYVFNSKQSKIQERFVSDQETLQVLHQRYQATQSLCPKNEFNSLQQCLKRDQVAKLQQKNQKVLELNRNLLDIYDQIIRLTYKYCQAKQCDEEVLTKCQYQAKSCPILFKRLAFLSEQLAVKKNSVLYNLQSFSDRFQSLTRQIEQLRQQEVHEKLHGLYKTKSLTGLKLFDLYYDEQKYGEFVKKMQNNIVTLKRRVDNIGKDADVIGGKSKAGQFYDQKKAINNKIKTIRKETQQVANKIQVDSNRIDAIRDIFRKRCSKMMDCINNFLKNPEDSEALVFLQTLPDFLQMNQRQLKEFIVQINGYIEEMQSSWVVLNNHNRSHEQSVRLVFSIYQKYEREIANLQTELKRSEKEIAAMSKQCDLCHTPKQIYEGYNMSLKEAARRHTFLMNFQNIFAQMSQMAEEEQEKRKKYINSRKTVRPKEIVSTLMYCTTPNVMINTKCDADLPRFDNITLEFEKIQPKHEPDALLHKIYEQFMNLTADLGNYKKNKENIGDSARTKLSNLEDILTKTTKICHQLYNRKLKDDTKIYTQQIQTLKMEATRLNLEIQSYTKKQFQKKKTTEISRLKEEQLRLLGLESQKKSQQLRQLSSQMKELERILRQEKQLAINQANMLREQLKLLEGQSKQFQQKALNLENSIKIVKQENRNINLSLLHSEKQRLRLTSQLKQKIQSHDDDRLHQLETENMEIRDINEQLEIEYKCKQASFREKLQVEIDKNVESQKKLREVAHSLESQKELVLELKMMLGDKEVMLIEKQEKIKKMQQELEQQSAVMPQQMELGRLRQENALLKNDIEELENELRLIVMKDTEDIEVQTDQDERIDIGQVEPGKKMIFIPYSTGVYLPLAIVDSQRTQLELATTTISSYHNNYFLDMSTLEPKTRDFLNECSLIIISRVGAIKKHIVTEEDNPYMLKHHDTYHTVEVTKPQFIVGFEDEDISLKNYAEI